jgi:ATP-binding cassette subfamily D (ALD) long-chain fatty acid import protein
MINLGDAGGRIMYSYKELSELAGYTHRVYTMLLVMSELSKNQFKPKPPTMNMDAFAVTDIKGTITSGPDGIIFEDVPICTPFGDTLLVRDLSFSVKEGDHLMITGPNGSGKTAILRVLAGLWPQFRGQLQRPDNSLNSIVYIPQRPYLSLGTLRDQIIYPHSQADMMKLGVTDSDLEKILKIVFLDYIPAREGGLDASKEWKDVFSGGEKQRIQLARLFYHKPKFVVFDEATSAVSNDVEALLYSATKDEGITIITISHRPSLLKYHNLLLKIGEGNDGTRWELTQVSTRQGLVESVENEIKKIEAELKNTERLKARLYQINKELQLDNNTQLKNARRTLI